MKKRIAKKKLKKVLSEAYRKSRKRIRLTKVEYSFYWGYRYSGSNELGFTYINIPKKKPLSIEVGLWLTIDAILGEVKAKNKPAKKCRRSNVQH